jgi:Protein of unknown function (DUF3025)
LASLDWLAPWWNPWRTIGQQVAAQVLRGARVCDALNAVQQASCTAVQAGDAPLRVRNPRPLPLPLPLKNSAQIMAQSVATSRPIRFVPQTSLPEGVAYEAFIFESGEVPTRENLHDFFNGLAWLVFPHTKRRLNALQYSALAADGVRATRGALRDALTLFDENAAIWPCASGAAASPATESTSQLAAALRARQWQRAFVDLRAQWQGNPPVLFGHALLEKLVTPYKSITAHVFIAQAATEAIAIADLDKATALQLSPAVLAPKPFIPLPVLGVPLWWAANEDPAFYNDAQVFRPPREVALTHPKSTPKP